MVEPTEQEELLESLEELKEALQGLKANMLDVYDCLADTVEQLNELV